MAQETGFDWYCDGTPRDGIAHFTSTEGAQIRKILRYAESHPNEVRILKMPEENDGYILADVPKSWFTRWRPPTKRPISDEQKAAGAARLAKWREDNT